ncbi:putative vesicle-mediated transport protein Vid24 [Talaromyces proteolyticus]|uniref:Vesicle-mediated transport protein Vid24 n=1 Tax=Talaromyces proteolyticus TaxID=1131652 RepID=A0AAD4KQY6_9EURO|nr:putative vesicle-mediated transport protein Vid24 [Talaromyces proteolyticus]KAH8697346.1 putative vesicle-mediated transport protein Vid24 [Talaromyces proteolyticus]
MPTPSDNTAQLTTRALADEEPTITHTTCPPEIIRGPTFSVAPEERIADEHDVVDERIASAAGSTEDRPSSDATSLAIASMADSSIKMANPEEDAAMTSLSPASAPSESREDQTIQSSPTVSPTSSVASSTSVSSSFNYEFSNIRLLPNHTSSFLRAGSKFEGTQQSDHQVYKVDVEIKHVDMAESYLCGYLCIQGLTEDHPTLTTFFEGEIIGTKHTFQTKNEAWGANEKTDMQHWARFEAWRPLAKQAKKEGFTYRNIAQREHIFMRWKEYFLVPDHRVHQISGASFEGFYYICFNQVQGTVSGIYFHAKSEKYQQLELKHVEDHGCTPAIEFR